MWERAIALFSVLRADCDDRALQLLLSRESSAVEVRHLLWEQDEADEELGRAGPRRRFWSDAYRDEAILADVLCCVLCVLCGVVWCGVWCGDVVLCCAVLCAVQCCA